MRHQPPARPLVTSLVVSGVVLATFLATSAVLGVRDDQLLVALSSARGVLATQALPEAVGVAVLLVAIAVLPWRRDVLTEADGGRRSWWLVLPVLVGVLAVAKYPFGLGSDDLGFFAAVAVWTLLTGVFEELLVRGVLLTGLRSRTTEFVAFAVSTVVFGLLHGVNVLFGAPVDGTIGQMVLATGLGSLLYTLRRVTGTIVWPVLLHALWDFATFTLTGVEIDPASVAGVLTVVAVAAAFLGGIVSGVVTARRSGNPGLAWRPVRVATA